MGVSRTVLKTLTAVFGGMLILGGAGLMYLTYPYLENKSTHRLFEGMSWLPAVFVYGVCSAVIILGILQIISCKWDVPGYLYEILGIVVFAAFLGVFIGLWVVKDRYLKNLKGVVEDPEFSTMYRQLQASQSLVFKVPGYCNGKTKIQDCTDLEMALLFPVPHERKFFDTGFLLETFAVCSGMSSEPAAKYFFTGNLYSPCVIYRDAKPSVSCKDKVDYFVENYGHFTAGATVGIVVCVILLASIIIGLCVRLQKREMVDSEPLYYAANF